MRPSLNTMTVIWQALLFIDWLSVSTVHSEPMLSSEQQLLIPAWPGPIIFLSSTDHNCYTG
jgi:hypothetical protein